MPRLLVVTGLPDLVDAWHLKDLGGQPTELTEDLARTALAAFQESFTLQAIAMGIMEPLHVSPAIQTVRLLKTGSQTGDIFYMAVAYQSEAASLEPYGRLQDLREDANHYASRFITQEGRQWYVIFAAAMDLMTKDILARFDWGEGDSVTERVPDSLVVDFGCRFLHIAPDGVEVMKQKPALNY